jgi:protoporphyrinogen oxidase
MSNRKVIVVGAGIGGLAAAHSLRQRGYEVEVLEASNRPGGRMMTLEHRGDRVDVGAQFYHSNFRSAFELMDAVGVGGEKRMLRGSVQYSLRDGGHYLYNQRNPYMKLLGWRGNLKLYRFVLRYVLLGRRFSEFAIREDIPEYDDIGILDLYDSPSDRTIRDYLVTMLTMGEALALPEWVSLYHFIRLFRLTLFCDYFGLVRGVSALAEGLAAQLPVEYETPVRQLVLEKGRAVGVELEGDGRVRKAEHVIVAVTPPVAAGLLPEGLDEQRRFFESVKYAPLPMPVFFIDRPLRRDVWCYFNDPSLRRTFMFAIDAHAKVPEMCPSGKAALTGWAVYPTTLSLMDESDETILSLAREDMELMVPGFSGWIEEAKVVRHAFVNAVYPPGAYRHVLDFQEGAGPLRGVSFSSSALHGMSMEAAIRSAAAAVRRVCAEG